MFFFFFFSVFVVYLFIVFEKMRQQIITQFSQEFFYPTVMLKVSRIPEYPQYADCITLYYVIKGIKQKECEWTEYTATISIPDCSGSDLKQHLFIHLIFIFVGFSFLFFFLSVWRHRERKICIFIIWTCRPTCACVIHDLT